MKSQWWYEQMATIFTPQQLCSISSLFFLFMHKMSIFKIRNNGFFCIFLIRTYKSCVICLLFFLLHNRCLWRNLSLLGFPLGRDFFSFLISLLFLSLAYQTFFSAQNERRMNACDFYNAIIIFNVSHFVYRGRCCASCTNFQSLCWEIIISRSVYKKSNAIDMKRISCGMKYTNIYCFLSSSWPSFSSPEAQERNSRFDGI